MSYYPLVPPPNATQNIDSYFQQSVPYLTPAAVEQYDAGQLAVTPDGYGVPIGQYFTPAKSEMTLSCVKSNYVPDIGGYRCSTVNAPLCPSCGFWNTRSYNY